MALGTERIARLRSLIEHPRTGAAERAAAQRVLDRILGRSDQPRPASGDRVYGERHDRGGRHAGLSRVADLIQEDIALARIFPDAAIPGDLATRNAIRDAPPHISYQVDAPYEAGIRITVTHVPPAWGWTDIGTESAALRHLTAELTAIMNAYNRDGAEIGKRFHGYVEVRGEGAPDGQ
ncbi:hypothetical protein ACWELJ_10470 [Nocardia sp. NPDC004582]